MAVPDPELAPVMEAVPTAPEAVALGTIPVTPVAVPTGPVALPLPVRAETPERVLAAEAGVTEASSTSQNVLSQYGMDQANSQEAQ